MYMTRDMDRETLHRQVELEIRQTKLQRALHAAVELRCLEVIRENLTHNRFFQKTMIDSDVACRLSFYSYSASEKLQIMTDMSREFGIGSDE